MPCCFIYQLPVEHSAAPVLLLNVKMLLVSSSGCMGALCSCNWKLYNVLPMTVPFILTGANCFNDCDGLAHLEAARRGKS